MLVACDNLVKKKIGNLFIEFFAKIELPTTNLEKIAKFFNNFFAIIKIRIIRVEFQNPCIFLQAHSCFLVKLCNCEDQNSLETKKIFFSVQVINNI